MTSDINLLLVFDGELNTQLSSDNPQRVKVIVSLFADYRQSEMAADEKLAQIRQKLPVLSAEFLLVYENQLVMTDYSS